MTLRSKNGQYRISRKKYLILSLICFAFVLMLFGYQTRTVYFAHTVQAEERDSIQKMTDNYAEKWRNLDEKTEIAIQEGKEYEASLKEVELAIDEKNEAADALNFWNETN